ncbi:MAG TPA: head GIN domain-containing protein [Spirochaetia bacterium]|nr:head GIN domain-containing protein [Spirochaetia bacterium]
MKRAVPAFALVLALVCAAAFASGDFEDGHGWIVGSGHVQSTDRDLPSFTAIDLEGSGNVVIRQDGTQLVSVETDDNVLPLVRTEVVDGVLHLGLVRGAHVTHLTRLEFSVAAPRVDGICISGSGNASTATPLRVNGMSLEIRGSGSIDCDTRAATVSAAIGGSGSIHLRGSSDRFTVTISGSGGVHAQELQSADAAVTINGSGDAQLIATHAIEVSLSGSGSVRYGGGARATVHRSGSGSVTEL